MQFVWGTGAGTLRLVPDPSQKTDWDLWAAINFLGSIDKSRPGIGECSCHCDMSSLGHLYGDGGDQISAFDMPYSERGGWKGVIL